MFEYPSIIGKNNTTQDIVGKQIGSFQRFWYAHFRATTPISYDPTTDAVAVIVTDYVLKPEFNGTKVFMLRTTNKGNDWDSINIYRNPLKSPLWGSISLNNPKRSTDISEVSYVASFRKVWKDTTYE